jgi:hypothetical protein
MKKTSKEAITVAAKHAMPIKTPCSTGLPVISGSFALRFGELSF